MTDTDGEPVTRHALWVDTILQGTAVCVPADETGQPTGGAMFTLRPDQFEDAP